MNTSIISFNALYVLIVRCQRSQQYDCIRSFWLVMRIKELKQQVYEEWHRRHWYHQAVCKPTTPTGDEMFKREIRTYGDLRFKATWVKALARFSALNSYEACLDASNLILYDFNFTPDRWDYEFRHQVIEEFLMLPGALDLIRLGLEQLFSDTFTQQERSQANGFFELVQEHTGTARRIATEPIGQLYLSPSATAG